MHESTERKRRLRQKRRDANIQAYEVWLSKALVDEVKRPDESINALVSRALNLLKPYTSYETSHETSPNFRGYTIVPEPSERPTTRIRYERVETRDTAHTVPSHETSHAPQAKAPTFSDQRRDILTLLRQHPEGLSPVQTRQLLRIEKDLGNTMKSMARDGFLQRVRPGIYTVAEGQST